jgi:hypothetical protein
MLQLLVPFLPLLHNSHQLPYLVLPIATSTVFVEALEIKQFGK